MVENLAPKQGFTVKRYSISSTNDLEQVGGQMVSQVDAVFVPTDNTIASAMQTLVSAANAKKIPVFPTVDTMVKMVAWPPSALTSSSSAWKLVKWQVTC